MIKPLGQAPELKGEITPEYVKEGTEIDFDQYGQVKWQEYRTASHWIVMVRPEVGRIVRLKYYSRMGSMEFLEPTYWANIQPVYRVRKA